LIVSGDKFTVIDLGSMAGTIIDGNKQPIYPGEPHTFTGGVVLRLGAKIMIAVKADAASAVPAGTETDNTDEYAEKSVAEPASAPQQEDVAKSGEAAATVNDALGDGEKKKIPVLEISGLPAEIREIANEIKKQAHKELLLRLNLKKLALSGASDSELKEQARRMIREILGSITVTLPPQLPLSLLERELFQEAVGLGPLEDLIARDDISEIMVNSPDQVYVEKGGVIYRTDTSFADNNQVLSAIERIVAPLGRRIDESSPMVDARLEDGSRVNAIIPPLTLGGPTITIRKFSRRQLTFRDLISFGSISEDMVAFLAVCVKIRKNILISGGTGSGKTTLLNILSGFLPDRERIITIEDAAELQLHQEHLVRLESRPPNIEGKGAITIRDLVRNSLRMRPDRIVVGECRGGEALDMLQAMNTGHDGSMTTIHANTTRDALSRLETLVLMAGFDLPLRAIREQIASAIDIVVQISRERDGSRKVMSISEVVKMEGDIITMQEIFRFRQSGWSKDNRITGVFEPCGNIPSFMEDVARANFDLDISMFSSTPKIQ
jgi:pilus assembly protein CpaF